MSSKVYIVLVSSRHLPCEHVYGVFTSVEDARSYVELSISLDWLQSGEKIYFLRDSNTWRGYRTDTERNMLVYAGVCVSVSERTVLSFDK